MSMREKDQADFDLERCFEMFDEALMSKDERVVNALRSLLMIVALTAPETGPSDPDVAITKGPLRRLIENQTQLIRRIGYMEEEIAKLKVALQQNNAIYRSSSGGSNWPYGPGGGYSPSGGGYGPWGGSYGGGDLVVSGGSNDPVLASIKQHLGIKDDDK